MLLLSCCAPCSCGVIEKLAKEGRNFAVLFYNPNIAPFDEYQKRLAENKRVCDVYHVDFIEGTYDFNAWREAVKGLEDEPERGKRCSVCFSFRLKWAKEYAEKHGFDSFSSVLGISRWKDLDQVNRCAKMAESADMPYDFTNWRKGGIQERRQSLIKELALYNQEYCGCPFSMKAAMERKALKKAG